MAFMLTYPVVTLLFIYLTVVCRTMGERSNVFTGPAQEWADTLNLIPHPESGFFIETYRAGTQQMKSQGRTSDDGKR